MKVVDRSRKSRRRSGRGYENRTQVSRRFVLCNSDSLSYRYNRIYDPKGASEQDTLLSSPKGRVYRGTEVIRRPNDLVGVSSLCYPRTRHTLHHSSWKVHIFQVPGCVWVQSRSCGVFMCVRPMLLRAKGVRSPDAASREGVRSPDALRPTPLRANGVRLPDSTLRE